MEEVDPATHKPFRGSMVDLENIVFGRQKMRRKASDNPNDRTEQKLA